MPTVAAANSIAYRDRGFATYAFYVTLLALGQAAYLGVGAQHLWDQWLRWNAIATFLLLKLVGVFVPLRMTEKNMEIGDVAEHGHEVYPSDVPSLGFPGGIPGLAHGAGEPAHSVA